MLYVGMVRCDMNVRLLPRNQCTVSVNGDKMLALGWRVRKRAVVMAAAAAAALFGNE